jgi:DNA-binding NarL/FixJ family response regulator
VIWQTRKNSEGRGNVIRLLIVDDHQLVRRGLRALLKRAEDIEIIGEAQDGQEAIDLIKQLHPDVVTMDIQMPRLDGLRATKQLMSNGSEVKILMVAMSWDKMVLQHAMEIGARGFLVKGDGYLELIDAIHSVYAGKTYLSPLAQRQLDGNQIKL